MLSDGYRRTHAIELPLSSGSVEGGVEFVRSVLVGSVERCVVEREAYEASLLGSMLIDDECIEIVRRYVPVFKSEAHRLIYGAILDICDSEPLLSPDQVGVCEKLSRDGTLEAAGGAYGVAHLAGEMASSVNAEYYARILCSEPKH